MATDETNATHSAYLELKEERLGLQEGYRFLDEKRLILAGEILAQLARYEEEMAALRERYQRAGEYLAAAVVRHGLEGFSVYPPLAGACATPATRSRSVLGVVLHELEPAAGPDARAPEADSSPVDPSPEAQACREAFAALLPHAARLAILTGNLERLRRAYTKTARRARALEDVLLPEIDASLATIATALEELEREEVVRVRQLRR